MPTLIVGMLWFFCDSNMPTTNVGMTPDVLPIQEKIRAGTRRWRLINGVPDPSVASYRYGT